VSAIPLASPGDDPDCVNQSWYVAKERQHYIHPEGNAEPHFEEHAHRRDDDGGHQPTSICASTHPSAPIPFDPGNRGQDGDDRFGDCDVQVSLLVVGEDVPAGADYLLGLEQG
jgi:hypothetical protein